MIRADRVSLQLDGRGVLDEVNLELALGQVHAVLGPNGAGKSSLLSLLAGDRAPSSGSVELGGRPLGQWRAVELARERAVFTQEHTVSFGFRAREVVSMGRFPWLGTEREALDDAAVSAALDLVDLAERAEQPVSTMSGGERARVAMARVLAQDTEALLLDEPTAALDLRHQEETLALVRHIAHAVERPRAVLIVLHDLNLAAAYADVVSVLAGGRLVRSGPPAEMLTAELIETVWGQAVEVLQSERGPVFVPRR